MRERELFIEALQRDRGDARAAYLEEACGGDDVLRGKVERLLVEHERQESFILDVPLPGIDATIAQLTPDAPNAHIGPYHLVEQIGEGGFGAVYLAEQQRPVRRQVALKILKPGMDTRDVVGRFQAERQALALMDHPHIAKVLDAGATETGRPYFVMELVKGVPITDYCDQCSLPMRERLELFLQVCQAVQHAHQKGIIHRDLKPSNVLVAIQDGQPAPKVIDFGVAKAINQRLTDDSLRTGFTQLVGTPLYMSPEQAEMSPLEIDTRGDIYSLGVLLYELLTGTTPFVPQRLKEASFDELRRIIREEEPPTPSSRISTLGEAASTIAVQRRTDPRRLIQAVRGDLDWIAMKCLEKDRTRRYETADALARDIQRYLRHEPVEACPPSAQYRLRKLIRRRRGPMIAAALVLVSLVAGVIGTTIGMLRAQAAREEAALAGEQTLAALATLTDNIIERQLARGAQVTDEDRAFLNSVLEHYERFAENQGRNPVSRVVRAQGHYRMGFIRTALGEHASAQSNYEQARDEYLRLTEDYPDEPEYREGLAAVHNSLGCLLKDVGKFTEGEQELTKSLELYEQLAQEFPLEPSHRLSMAMNLNNLSNLRAQLNVNAEPEARASVALMTELVTEFPDSIRFQEELARSINSLGIRLQGMGRFAAQAEECRRAIDVQKKIVAKRPSVPTYRQHLALYHNNLGGCFVRDLRFDDALASFRDSLTIYQQLSADYPAVPDYQHEQARCHGNLAVTLHDLKQLDAAEAENRLALAIREKLAKDYPAVVDYQDELAVSLINTASLLGETGRVDQALAHCTRAIATLDALLESDQRLARTRFLLQTALEGHARALVSLDRLDEALADYNRAIAVDQGRRGGNLLMRRARLQARVSPAEAVAAAEAAMARASLYVIAVYEAACVNLIAATHAASGAERDRFAARGGELIEKARQLGLLRIRAAVRRMQLDPDLATLRRFEPFEKLFQEPPESPPPMTDGWDGTDEF